MPIYVAVDFNEVRGSTSCDVAVDFNEVGTGDTCG